MLTVGERPGEAIAELEIAITSADRRRGLLGRTELRPGNGMLLSPCRSVHTWFMRFAIDVIFADGRQQIVKIAHAVPPYRIVWGGWRTQTTIELAAGAARAHDLRAGTTIAIVEPSQISPAAENSNAFTGDTRSP